MIGSSYRISQALLVLVGLWSLFATRYSKVEESFQLQATHDLYYHGIGPALRASWNKASNDGGVLEKDLDPSSSSSAQVRDIYDHLQFPGVVPRSFVGPWLLSLQCRLARLVYNTLHRIFQRSDGSNDSSKESEMPPFVVEYLARFFVLAWNWIGWFRFSRALDQKCSTTASTTSSGPQQLPLLGTYLLLVTASQFHMVYYASRMLPNAFATAVTLQCFAAWVENRIPQSAVLLVMATAVFRCDLVLLLFTVGVSWLVCRQLTILRALQIGMVTGAACLALTIPLDSILWQQWTWPEGTVLYYNTVLNKSSDWGTSPWHWYWTSALPKALLLSLPMVPLSLVQFPDALLLFSGAPSKKWLTNWKSTIDPTWLPFVLPAVGYVALYSFLGHKEVRFLFPALPLFNLGAAVTLSKFHAMTLQEFKDKPIRGVSRLLYVGCVAALLVSLALSFLFVAVSRQNYPGGQALEILTAHIQAQLPSEVRVHVDVASAMTGVSKFAERQARYETPNVRWIFTKAGYEAEHATPSAASLSAFTHLLSEDPNVNGFRILQAVPGNPRFDVKRLRIVTSDAIYVLENENYVQR